MRIVEQKYPFSDVLDKSTKSHISIDYPHHEIHAGSHFFFCVYDADVDTAGPKYIRVTTPNTAKWSNFIVSYTSTGAGLWQFFENPTLNVAGTEITIYNNDRNSLNTATLTAFQDTTTTGDGTELWCDMTGADGIGGSRTIGNSSRDNEIILKQNEDYILKFTPDADNAKIIVNVAFYEHTNE